MNCNEKNKCLYPDKDYCECVKKSLKQSKKNSRDRNVNGTLTFLKKNNVLFEEGKITNTVIVNPETDNIFLSLKKVDNMLKCRYVGSSKWYTFSKKVFLAKFSKKTKYDRR